MPRATVKKYGKECRVLQPSVHPLIKDYEKAQDSVGEWFGQIGLVRGERDAAARREAYDKGETPPPKRRHVRTRDWRIEQEQKIEQLQAELALKAKELDTRANDLGLKEQVVAEQADDLSQRETEVAEKEVAVSVRNAEVAEKEAALVARREEVEAREARIATREVEVEATIAVAEAVASGAIDLDAPADTPFKPTDKQGAEAEVTSAKIKADAAPDVSLGLLARLRAGWQRMRKEARDKAETEARETFQDAHIGLTEAAQLLRETASALPVAERPAFKVRQSRFKEIADRIGRQVSRSLTRFAQEDRVASRAKKNSDLRD